MVGHTAKLMLKLFSVVSLISVSL